MKTLLIDCEYPIEDSFTVAFDSPASCFDFDIVIWDVAGTYENYEIHSATHQGLPALSDSSSVSLMKALMRRRGEFKELLAMGRAVIIFPAIESSVYCATGETRSSGTGRNAKTTRMLATVDLYNAIPFALETTSGNGLAVEPAGATFAPLWRETKGYWVYRSILDVYPGDKVAQIANTKKVVGSLLRTQDGGVLAILPEPYWENGSNVTDDGSSSEEEDEHNSVPELLHKWVCEQLGEEIEPEPQWVSSYSFPEEVSLTSAVSKLQLELDEVLRKLDKMKSKQLAESRWKRLLFSSGAALESEVERALLVLGFTILPAVSGRADVRAEADGKKIVFEIKGLSKSAAEKNAAQLEKWVAEEAIDGETGWKPVLVVNAWREVEIDQRGEPSFPDQMLRYSESRGHCLMTTSQLLYMARAVLVDPAKAESIRGEIFSTVGVVSGWEVVDVILKSSDAV